MMFDSLDGYKDHFDDLSEIFERFIQWIKESFNMWLSK
jgi:hypothetical protein